MRRLIARLGSLCDIRRTPGPAVDYHRVYTSKSMVSKRLQSLGLFLCIAGLLLPILYGANHKAEKLGYDRPRRRGAQRV